MPTFPLKTGTPQATFSALPEQFQQALLGMAQAMGAPGPSPYRFGMPTLLDIATHNAADSDVGLIDETIGVHPELHQGAARTIKGLNYKTLVRTGLPEGSFFRSANEGVAAKKGKYENRLIETYPFNPRWECDVVVAGADEDGPEAYIALEAEAVMEAAWIDLCSQFYYGTVYGPKGFPGLAQSYDKKAMLVDGGGSGAGSIHTSVWAVRFGPQAVQWVWGNGGELAMSDLRVESITDDNGNRFSAYVQEMVARPGLQVGSTQCVGRLANLNDVDADAGLDDAKIAKLLTTFKTGRGPHALLMTKEAQEQLRTSRTATNATGAPAPTPDEAFSVPILPTESIVNTEKKVA